MKVYTLSDESPIQFPALELFHCHTVDGASGSIHGNGINPEEK
jgi:hypothetical protein